MNALTYVRAALALATAMGASAAAVPCLAEAVAADSASVAIAKDAPLTLASAGVTAGGTAVRRRQDADIVPKPAAAPTIVPGRVEWHGYIQQRMYSPSGAQTQMKLERLSLSGKMPIDTRSFLYSEVYYHQYAPKPYYLDSLYYDLPVGDGRLRIGRGRLTTFSITPTGANRKTSNYGLIAEAFTQDRIYGIQYNRSKGRLDTGISVHPSFRMGKRLVGDAHLLGTHGLNNCVPHLAFRDLQDQISDKLSVSARVGMHWGPGLKVGLSAQYGDMDDRDFAAMVGATSTALRPKNPFTGQTSTALGANFTNHTLGQYALDATYKQKPGFITQFEGYLAHASNQQFGGWSFLTGWDPPKGWRFYCRYGQQLMGGERTDNPLTWDQGQLVFSAVQPLRKNAWLQYEYEINSNFSNTGSHVRDNIFLTELMLLF